ncbi:long-chain fatty acid--CoA ligase [Methylocapsa sp. S129]|uniref:AMP-dependent synthetase/ligase n=1 Tax=Methylocapsa sp. S129 TaxID=1641869 RepID=UPI001FEF422E|nr:AMP-binding protein [Methylocapsa sp. S129]
MVAVKTMGEGTSLALPPQRESEDTFAKLLRRHARVRGSRPAFRHKELGVWRTWTWAEVYAQTRALAQGLAALGLSHGDKIAIVGANKPRLYWAMTAAQMLGAIPLPVYADAVADEMAYVLSHAEVTLIVAQDQEQVDKILSIADRLPRLTRILYDEERGLTDYRDARLASLEDIIGTGDMALRAPAAAAALDATIDAGNGADPSVILYTSGTTGRPKGVVLTGERCVAAARDTVAFDKLTERDEVLAYLPLAWVGDHYLNYAQAFVAGFCMACPESAETAAEDLREIGPTFHFAPPRVFEALLTRVMIRMEDAGAIKRAMFHHFLAVAKKWGEKIGNGQPVPPLARMHYAIGEALVYGPLKNVLGFSKIRVAYTAGEAIGADLFAFYRSLGLNLKQLYGQTEAFLYVTAQANGAVRSDAVGPPAPHVELRIDGDGEVQFKSPGMFTGYFQEPGRTAETLTADGFVRTGDAGYIEPDGQLKIVDRARDVGKLASGQMFAPKYIENKLKFFPNIKEAVAIGQGRDHVFAMLNIELASVGNWAERNNVSYGSYQELAGHPLVYAMIQAHVDEVNRALAREPIMAGAQIKRFLILPKELDADDGELTRTQKVRRGFIAERYASLVAGLYDGATTASISAEITYEDGRKGLLNGSARIVEMTLHPAEPQRERAA